MDATDPFLRDTQDFDLHELLTPFDSFPPVEIILHVGHTASRMSCFRLADKISRNPITFVL